MVQENLERLPSYDLFADNIAALALPISASELHGVMCGYLCAGASREGESYLQALMFNRKKDDLTRIANLEMFKIYSVSQHQLANLDFEFQMLLPEDEEALVVRAQAFSEWCEGFTQGMTLAGVSYEQLEEEDSQDALQHIQEFAQLDYENLEVSEEDEKALVDVSEYARMAVLRLCGDLQANDKSGHAGSAH